MNLREMSEESNKTYTIFLEQISNKEIYLIHKKLLIIYTSSWRQIQLRFCITFTANSIKSSCKIVGR